MVQLRCVFPRRSCIIFASVINAVCPRTPTRLDDTILHSYPVLRAAAKRIRISTRTARRTGARRRIKQLVNLRLLAKVERYISRGFCCRRMIRRSLPLSRGNHLGYSWERGSERSSDSGAGRDLRALQSTSGGWRSIIPRALSRLTNYLDDFARTPRDTRFAAARCNGFSVDGTIRTKCMINFREDALFRGDALAARGRGERSPVNDRGA